MKTKINDSDLISNSLTRAFDEIDLKKIKSFQLTCIKDLVSLKKTKNNESQRQFDRVLDQILKDID